MRPLVLISTSTQHSGLQKIKEKKRKLMLTQIIHRIFIMIFKKYVLIMILRCVYTLKNVFKKLKYLIKSRKYYKKNMKNH